MVVAGATAAVVAVASIVALASLGEDRCGGLLALSHARAGALGCDPWSNGVELASYRCPVPEESGVDYGALSALLTGPDGRVLGRWDAPIVYEEDGRAQPRDSWGPLDTSSGLVDDGDLAFGPGDVFHLDAVQGYRFDGSSFEVSGDCWAASTFLE